MYQSVHAPFLDRLQEVTQVQACQCFADSQPDADEKDSAVPFEYQQNACLQSLVVCWSGAVSGCVSRKNARKNLALDNMVTDLLVTRSWVLGSDLPSHPAGSEAMQHMYDGIQELPGIQWSE